MSTTEASSTAAAYAEAVVNGVIAPLRWSDLESSAFGRVPEVYEAAVAAGADLDRDRRGWDHALDAAWLAVLFAPLALPVLTIFAVKDADDAANLYGVIGLISAAHLLLRVLEWQRTRTGRARATARETLLAGFEACFALISAGLLAAASWAEQSWWLWSLCGVQIAVTVSCVVSVPMAQQAARRGVPVVARPAFEEFAARVAALDDDDRAAIQADLNTALDCLEDAGFVSPPELAEARRAPLGSLARRLWVLERSAARQAR
ncbi:hypothetical protein STRCI_008168 [Streptomyces cinnabarinus]|uniref:Uncharacterized protein n=1 Tax=Streptomyces cinnabarinus TaxID=67287 RepID=A0ABY7KQF3_9ACTN|nr:hypothetical protein [Streptomyces cinnabarinus]WAZ26574.1 hypothetical protein STRCI_008168 [Streptomyces cinnabarinus]